MFAGVPVCGGVWAVPWPFFLASPAQLAWPHHLPVCTQGTLQKHIQCKDGGKKLQDKWTVTQT